MSFVNKAINSNTQQGLDFSAGYSKHIESQQNASNSPLHRNLEC